jgi:hypothetical protein
MCYVPPPPRRRAILTILELLEQLWRQRAIARQTLSEETPRLVEGVATPCPSCSETVTRHPEFMSNLAASLGLEKGTWSPRFSTMPLRPILELLGRQGYVQSGPAVCKHGQVGVVPAKAIRSLAARVVKDCGLCLMCVQGGDGQGREVRARCARVCEEGGVLMLLESSGVGELVAGS